MQSGIEASVKFSKLSMSSDETVGKYLTRARADAYYVCNGLLKTGLKSQILRRVSQFKTYKNFFDHIKDEWEQRYFMEDDFAEQSNTQNTTAEVNEVYTWNEAIPKDPTKEEKQVEINEVYHRYRRYPTQCGHWAPGPRPQGNQAPFRGGQGGQRPYTSRHHTP